MKKTYTFSFQQTESDNFVNQIESGAFEAIQKFHATELTSAIRQFCEKNHLEYRECFWEEFEHHQSTELRFGNPEDLTDIVYFIEWD